MMQKLALYFILFMFYAGSAQAQLIDESGYLLGNYVEVGINANGHEGAPSIAGDHARSDGDSSVLGMVANPQMDGWVEYNGDFFIPGSPVNGFGFEIEGVNYLNNMIWGDLGAPGEIVGYAHTGNCISLDWEGSVEGVEVGIEYRLIEDALYYTTKITLLNTNPDTLHDLFYFRSLDPDNNRSIDPTPEGFNTTNTVVSQAGEFCQLALISAEQATPWDSYLGFCAVGENFRCARGGFFVNDGSDVWNGTGAYSGEVGDSFYGDQAISLAYKIETFLPGEEETFEFAVVFAEEAVEDALSNLFYITADVDAEIGMSDCNHLMDTLILSCDEGSGAVTLTLNGPNEEDYEWVWSSEVDIDLVEGTTMTTIPHDTILYTVTGTPISDCLENEITKSILVVSAGGPAIAVTDPGSYCGEFDLTSLVFTDENDIPLTVSHFFTDIPDSASQTSPLFESDLLTADDTVYLMIGDTISGCFDWELIDIGISEPVNAGSDSALTICTYGDSLFDVNELITADADTLGVLTEITASGQFDSATGEFELTGLSGTYLFSYVLEAEAPCSNDTALYSIVVGSSYEEVIGTSAICEGDSLLIFDHYRSTAGVYYDTLATIYGCDSIFSHELIVNELPAVFFEDLEDEIVCLDASIINLLGTPSGGAFEGEGVSGTTFNPADVSAGNYWLSYTYEDDHSCSNTDSVQITVVDCLGINESTTQFIKVYPNPFNDFTTVYVGQEPISPYSIIIHDMLGKEVYRIENSEENNFKIWKNDLSSGVFFLSIINDNSAESGVVKLIIE